MAVRLGRVITASPVAAETRSVMRRAVGRRRRAMPKAGALVLDLKMIGIGATQQREGHARLLAKPSSGLQILRV